MRLLLALWLAALAGPCAAQVPAEVLSEALDALRARAPQGALEAPPDAAGEPVAPFKGGSTDADAPADKTTSFPAPVFVKNRLLVPLPGTDHDQDGLADLAEAELALGFRPYLVFDSHENARPAGEPVTLFQIRPVGCAGPRSRCGGKALTVKATYLNLWTWDKGYGPASIFCRHDKHKGDNQAVSLVLESKDDGRSFRVVSIDIGAFVWPAKSGSVQFLSGTHFWLYFSAGKHHHFFDTSGDHKPSPYSKWRCRENVDGQGFTDLARLSAPAAAGSFLWNNVGEPEAHPAEHFVSTLDAYKFPGEHAWGTTPFCGGLKCKADNPTSTNSKWWARDSFYLP